MCDTLRFGTILCMASFLMLPAASFRSLESAASADEPDNVRFLEPGESTPILDAMKESADQISARQINLFHLALLDRCFARLPADHGLSLKYGGIVAKDEGRKREGTRIPVDGLTLILGGGQRVIGDYGSPLEWTVAEQDSAVMSLWISVGETTETVTTCVVDGRTLHVNVSSVGMRLISGLDDAQKVLKQKRTELGNRSIVEFLSLLKQKNPDRE